jgi:hypothetical protein
MKQAKLIFIETDNQLEMKIDFDGNAPDQNCSAHMAVVKAYRLMNELLDAAEVEENAGQQ